MKKILIVQTRHIESISYLTAELVNAFPADEYQVTLAYLEAGEPNATDKLAHECYFLGLNKTDYKGLRLKAIKKLRPFFEQHQFDVVIANMYKPVHLLMQLRRSISASVCVGIIHAFGEFDRPMRRWAMRRALSKDSRWHLVGVSESVSQYLLQAQCGLHLRNTSTINNAINVASVDALALDAVKAREALKLPSAGIIFGTVGRAVKGKRQLELIEAFHSFAEGRSDAYLAVIGDGEFFNHLANYVARYKLQDKVFLIGYVPQAVRFLRAFDVFVFPSESEGFSIALLEAMALSRPILVNNIESLTSVIADTSAEMDSSDIQSMTRALTQYYELSPEYLIQKGMANYERVNSLYEIAQFRTSYRSLIDQLLYASLRS